jgi:hypothetical protein
MQRREFITLLGGVRRQRGLLRPVRSRQTECDASAC